MNLFLIYRSIKRILRMYISTNYLQPTKSRFGIVVHHFPIPFRLFPGLHYPNFWRSLMTTGISINITSREVDLLRGMDFLVFYRRFIDPSPFFFFFCLFRAFHFTWVTYSRTVV